MPNILCWYENCSMKFINILFPKFLLFFYIFSVLLYHPYSFVRSFRAYLEVVWSSLQVWSMDWCLLAESKYISLFLLYILEILFCICWSYAVTLCVLMVICICILSSFCYYVVVTKRSRNDESKQQWEVLFGWYFSLVLCKKKKKKKKKSCHYVAAPTNLSSCLSRNFHAHSVYIQWNCVFKGSDV
jgi:hypothetical protein